MARSKQQIGEARPVSRYKQKEQQRATGAREPFEFQEHPRRSSDPAPETTHPVWSVAGQSRQVVKAIARRSAGPSAKFILLKTELIPRIYLGLNVLQRTHSRDDVRKGFVIECEIGPPIQGTQDPRVTHIFSISPPPNP